MKTTSIEQLEQELAKAKQEVMKASWEGYFSKAKPYLESIVGKVFIKWSNGSALTIFKVKAVKEAYTTREGARGDWGPPRWFEVTASAIISCRVADVGGQYFRPSIKFSKLKFNIKKDNEVETSDISLFDLENELYTRDRVLDFGRKSYDDRIPFYDRDLDEFKIGLREVPEEVYLEAKKIAEDNVLKTKLFWDKYGPGIRKL